MAMVIAICSPICEKVIHLFRWLFFGCNWCLWFFIDGKAVFEANCKTCHGGMIPGAPVVGKKEDWAPRIKQGKDTLHKHAIEGFNSMPAKGGNGSLSDDEVKAAVDFMANESGAKF